MIVWQGGVGSAQGGLTMQAATPVDGVALINGTQTIVTWTAPNDGNLHAVTVFAKKQITSALTGGALTELLNATSTTVDTNTAVGNYPATTRTVTLQPGDTIALTSAAITAGAGVVYAEIWSS